MRVLRDVVVDRTDREGLLAVSHLPGVVGEEMSLGLFGGGSSLELRVEVLDSRPVILHGSVRHRLRLRLLPAGAAVPVSHDAAAGDALAAEAL